MTRADAVESTDVAQRYGASLRFVHAFQPVTYILPDACAVYSAPQLAEMLSELDELLSDEKRKAESAGVSNVTTELIQGVPATEIARDATQNGCGLIVVGTHGRTGLKHAVIWVNRGEGRPHRRLSGPDGSASDRRMKPGLSGSDKSARLSGLNGHHARSGF